MKNNRALSLQITVKQDSIITNQNTLATKSSRFGQSVDALKIKQNPGVKSRKRAKTTQTRPMGILQHFNF